MSLSKTLNLKRPLIPPSFFAMPIHCSPTQLVYRTSSVVLRGIIKSTPLWRLFTSLEHPNGKPFTAVMPKCIKPHLKCNMVWLLKICLFSEKTNPSTRLPRFASRPMNVVQSKQSIVFAFFLFSFLLIVILFSLLYFLDRLDESFPSKHSGPHRFKPTPDEGKETSYGLCPSDELQTSRFSQSGPRWILWGRRWSGDLLRCTKRRGKIVPVSHIFRTEGWKETREANGVPYPQGQSVGGYFLQSFTGCVYILHIARVLWTECEPHFHGSRFKLLSEWMCLPLALDPECQLRMSK